ncbi:MAG: dihydropteroate synthase [Lachnospiraceae bacterium]|nr:dihydropteroate synthase [Lachnospiraceae bacterium]
MNIGGREFDIKNHTYIMGILNVTPDSFSDGGKYSRLDDALFHVEEMIDQGMELLDIGGESTRPGYTLISAEEEIERVVPVIEAVKQRFDVPLSLDTYKAEVAKAGLRAGADMINDIWGLKSDPDMAGVIAKAGVPCVLMHNRKEADYHHFMEEVIQDLEDTIRIAKNSGIADDKIILDPGIGFGKTYEHNLKMIQSMDRLLVLGYPMLLGASRKSVIGLTLDLPAAERMEGTLVTTIFAVLKGCSFVRVHDIRENVRAVKMAEAILLVEDGSLPRGKFC